MKKEETKNSNEDLFFEITDPPPGAATISAQRNGKEVTVIDEELSQLILGRELTLTLLEEVIATYIDNEDPDTVQLTYLAVTYIKILRELTEDLLKIEKYIKRNNLLLKEPDSFNWKNNVDRHNIRKKNVSVLCTFVVSWIVTDNQVNTLH